MKIKYIHVSAPKTEKIHDTKQAYKNMAFAINDEQSKLYHATQAEFDEITLNNFKRDKQKGVVLRYEIMEF